MSKRVHTVDDIAQTACTKAIGYLRAGRPGRAEYELVRASSIERLAELRLFEPFHDPRLGDLGGAA